MVTVDPINDTTALTLPRILARNPLRGEDFLSIDDFTGEQLMMILAAADRLKSRRRTTQAREDEFRTALAGKHVALLFEKPSLRTKVTFQVAIEELGGSAVYLSPQEVGLGVRESVPDVARNLERWVDAIVARVNRHEDLLTLAAHASIPVVNALSDVEHPVQALADFMTIHERKKTFQDVKIAYVGDGNNVAVSLMLLAAKLGVSMAVAMPKDYRPTRETEQRIDDLFRTAGVAFQVMSDPLKAVKGADAVYTDTWVSMGQEAEAGKRREAFAGYQVNDDLMSAAGPNALFMHCLPAHRGEEVTDEVMDSPRSVIFDQAENRLHVHKAILLLALQSLGPVSS
jgi:ornithine carbamoyltransferase